MDVRILQRIAAESPLQTLIAAEPCIESLPMTIDPQPKGCRAWIRFGPYAVHTQGVVVKWNDISCSVRFQVADRDLECWVWANAVTPVD